MSLPPRRKFVRHDDGRLLTSVGVIRTDPVQKCMSAVDPLGVHHLRVMVPYEPFNVDTTPSGPPEVKLLK